jgi:transcriptional regulator with XRE-family HTH domain
MKTGELIRHYRKKNNLTQLFLSELFSFDPQFISLIENGHSKMPLDKGLMFCCQLGIDKKKMKKALLSDYEEKINQALELT